MNAHFIDGERLHKLLGGDELANLRLRLRARFERGASRDEFTLTALSSHERRALTGLLGRRTSAAGSMRIRCTELDAVLKHAQIAHTLRAALEFLDGPLSDRRAERATRDEAWSTALADANEPRLAALVKTVAGVTLVKRLSGSDPTRAAMLLVQSAAVLARLPSMGMSRAQLAAEVLGDSHGLDNGRPVATLVLRARAAETSIEPIEASELQDADETVRERWARLGITVNELALPALCMNLPLPEIDIEPGEPVHLSLRTLLRQARAWQVKERDVFVCENPNIIAIAADRLRGGCAPLVCTDGMPSAAQQTLLSQLAAHGARLRYHGDFDWPGLIIGNFVMREFGAEAWRFGTSDYVAATADHTIAQSNHTLAQSHNEIGPSSHALPLPKDKPVVAQWDSHLAVAMAERGIVVHEEAVVATLLEDLALAI